MLYTEEQQSLEQPHFACIFLGQVLGVQAWPDSSIAFWRDLHDLIPLHILTLVPFVTQVISLSLKLMTAQVAGARSLVLSSCAVKGDTSLHYLCIESNNLFHFICQHKCNNAFNSRNFYVHIKMIKIGIHHTLNVSLSPRRISELVF